jgi:superoxide dismutase
LEVFSDTWNGWRDAGQPKGKLLAAINRDFGSFDAFKDQFKAAGERACTECRQAHSQLT